MTPVERVGAPMLSPGRDRGHHNCVRAHESNSVVVVAEIRSLTGAGSVGVQAGVRFGQDCGSELRGPMAAEDRWEGGG